LGSVSPGHHLSAFADSGNLTEDEEHNSCQSLEGVVELELLVSDISWTFWLFHTLSSVVWVMWAMMWSTVDHFVGVSTGSHHLVERDGHTDGTDNDEGSRGVLDSGLVLLYRSLGRLQFLDRWVNWGLLQGA